MAEVDIPLSFALVATQEVLGFTEEPPVAVDIGVQVESQATVKQRVPAADRGKLHLS